MTLLCLIHLIVGYWIFWAGLSDDMAHIPTVAIGRVILAFAIGPEMLAFMWLFSVAYNMTHNYSWPRCYYRLDRDAALTEGEGR